MGNFAIGLLVGLLILWIYHLRLGGRRKKLLSRLAVEPIPSALSYETQIARTVSLQGEALASLQAQLEEHQRILQQAPVGYLRVDEENRLLSCNAQARLLLNIDQVDYAPPKLLLAIARSYELDQLVDQTRNTQAECKKEWTFRSISPDPFNLSERPAYPLSGYGLPLADGHVAIFLENRQEAVLIAQQRNRWTSDVAHELKTPLTSIRLVGETLQTRVAPNLVNWIERLLKEVNRLSMLVDDMLSLSNLEQQQEQPLDEADLVALIHQAWQGLEPQAKLRGARLIPEGLSQAVATVNSRLIYRVFLNLLDNALKYSPLDQPIHVGIYRSPTESGDGFLVEVYDSGSGFTAQDMPFVFDRFYRSDTSRARSGPGELASSGTGLGLSIVQTIVESHQGWVQAQNHPVTGGAWLKVWLPTERQRTAVADSLPLDQEDTL